MISERVQYAYFFTLLLGILIILYFVFKPFIVALFLAAMCAVACGGIHNWFVKRIPKSKNLAALLSVFAVLVIVFLPMGVLSVLIFNEARDFYNSLGEMSTPFGFIEQTVSNIENSIRFYVPQINLDLISYMQSGLQWIFVHASTFFASFIKILLGLFIMVIAMFYLFRDGAEFREFMVKVSPFDEKDDRYIIERIELTISSVIKGVLTIGVIQGLCTALGLWIFGVSQPILWGTVAAVASLIPGVGTAIVSVPVILFMISTGNIFGAIGYAIWAVLLTGSVDNTLGPILMEKRVHLHPLLILISVLGGLTFFGPIGFIVGPVVLAFASELIKLYPKFTTIKNG